MMINTVSKLMGSAVTDKRVASSLFPQRKWSCNIVDSNSKVVYTYISVLSLGSKTIQCMIFCCRGIQS